MPEKIKIKEQKILKEDELDKAVGCWGEYNTHRECPKCKNYTIWDNPIEGYYYCVTPGCDYKSDHS